MAAPPAPQLPATSIPVGGPPPADTPTFGEKWAFRAFFILFFLTLIIGLLHFLFSFYKYRS